MSREKSEKVCITFRLSEEEHEKLKQYSSACGLSAAEFMRQLCRGNAPQPMPQTEFWELLGKLYEVHDAFRKCVPFYPAAAEICKEIEQLVMDLQQRFTMHELCGVEMYGGRGVVFLGGNEPLAHRRTVERPDFLCGKSRKDRAE